MLELDHNENRSHTDILRYVEYEVFVMMIATLRRVREGFCSLYFEVTSESWVSLEGGVKSARFPLNGVVLLAQVGSLFETIAVVFLSAISFCCCSPPPSLSMLLRCSPLGCGAPSMMLGDFIEEGPSVRCRHPLNLFSRFRIAPVLIRTSAVLCTQTRC